MDTKKDSDQKSTYSKAAYAWLMTVTSYYKRVSDLGINIDELMTLNTVAANWLYKINSSDTKSLEELKGMSSDEIKKYFKGSKLSILSIANILSQPKESIRRRVQKLIDFQLLAKDESSGIILGENYTKDVAVPQLFYIGSIHILLSRYRRLVCTTRPPQKKT